MVGRLWARAMAAVVVGVVVVGVGCTSGGDGTSGASGTSGAETSAAEVETEAPAAAGQTFAVGRRNLTLVDESRPTGGDPNRGQTELDSRTLPTIVLYPAPGEPTAPVQPEAPIAEGSFPLVVFSHGVTVSGEIYAGFVEPLARQGYVVVLPTFPLTSGPLATQSDYVNQPGDVSFVVDELLGMATDAGSWLAGHLDGEHVAAAGHSLGAVTSLGVGYDDCCIDDRIDAVVSVSGIALDYPDGEYTWPETPLLLIHGSRDQIVPVSGSDTAFAEAQGPTWYLRFAEADHYGVGLGADGALTTQAAVAFLDAWLKDSPEGLEDTAAAVAASGRAEWRTANLDG